ncbi:MAG: ATP-dependent DNA helicase RecG [Anaerolineales bacterium]|nr:ATP-dependent DNA helicase RecG [Anaerolineales bacterium]
MQSSLEKLRKFFRLEAENGYNNSAIIGGLAKMLDYWESDARNEGLAEEVIQVVAGRLRDYGRLSPESRKETLKGIWNRVKKEYPEAGDKKTSQTRPQPAPAQKPESAPQQKNPPKREPAHRPAPPRSESAPGAKTSKTPIALNASLTVLQGVGPRNAKRLEKLGLYTLGDMLYNFPRRYDDYSQLKPIKSLWYGEQVTVIGAVKSVSGRPIRGGKSHITEVVISDGTGALRLSWFNQPWLTNRLKQGLAISVSGKIDQYLGRLVMNSPDWELVETESLHTNRIVPIYPLTANISQKWLRTQMAQVIKYWAPKLTDHLPESVRKAANLPSLSSALQQVHFPHSQEQLKLARERLAFDEIFFLQMGVLRQKRDWQSVTARIFDVRDEWLKARTAALPFTLTSVQQKAISDIVVDFGSGRPMNRLLQGDVGSGKTVVAAMAADIIASANAQAAIMAPTSILAEQHYRSISQMLTNGEDRLAPEQIRLLVGDTPEAEKEDIRNGLADGSIKIVVGTHALIEAPVQFADLQLAVIDEQHRFGVEQRSAWREKGENLHLLVMTATPIPRSLALTLHGDLDISVMDEMPAGRQPIETHVLKPRERERAYTMIRAQVLDGHQAFIIYPLVEESEKVEARAAVEEHALLQAEVFRKLKLGLLHGRMKPAEKDAVMEKFRAKEYDILVATTVVEVGVDVPNATVMLIEGADRFGLAQLHQLRGRVGRGLKQSYCLLIPTTDDDTENERLLAMAESNDGFVLAERDLQQRGPGEFLGTRQSGYGSGLRMASLTDIDLIEKARERAQALFAKDANLEQEDHKLLGEALERFWRGSKGDVS